MGRARSEAAQAAYERMWKIALSVPCHYSYCFALKGQKCKTRFGNFAVLPHQMRYRKGLREKTPVT